MAEFTISPKFTVIVFDEVSTFSRMSVRTFFYFTANIFTLPVFVSSETQVSKSAEPELIETADSHQLGVTTSKTN